ncbi:50S ribosomal protein L6 [Desulfoferrobacter suflitae]|uniref:50S ribosomal protein L6 n=1 Tax=Desulfoferrobacter suflitae TaxID=2865782 RepID=UPI0021642AEF|nr:50S ribosomal protein L6 [Desulfoferrobacter suflitae]MCK8602668.1 50S ribosomal protein L6 [Desulfoferrobacter suflitae]
MSRVGKLPIQIPQGVSVSFNDQLLTVKGPKGSLTRNLSSLMDVEVGEQTIQVKRNDDSQKSRALHGLTRALVYNMVHGVSQGFSRVLEIHGTGYRADVQNDVLNLSLGYAHPVRFQLPEGIAAAVERQTIIRLEGIDKELIGQAAADIRALRPVEPYKGKGIRYSDERVYRKAGKAGSKK